MVKEQLERVFVLTNVGLKARSGSKFRYDLHFLQPRVGMTWSIRSTVFGWISHGARRKLEGCNTIPTLRQFRIHAGQMLACK